MFIAFSSPLVPHSLCLTGPWLACDATPLLGLQLDKVTECMHVNSAACWAQMGHSGAKRSQHHVGALLSGRHIGIGHSGAFERKGAHNARTFTPQVKESSN